MKNRANLHKIDLSNYARARTWEQKGNKFNALLCYLKFIKEAVLAKDEETEIFFHAVKQSTKLLEEFQLNETNFFDPDYNGPQDLTLEDEDKSTPKFYSAEERKEILTKKFKGLKASAQKDLPLLLCYYGAKNGAVSSFVKMESELVDRIHQKDPKQELSPIEKLALKLQKKVKEEKDLKSLLNLMDRSMIGFEMQSSLYWVEKILEHKDLNGKILKRIKNKFYDIELDGDLNQENLELAKENLAKKILLYKESRSEKLKKLTEAKIETLKTVKSASERKILEKEIAESNQILYEILLNKLQQKTCKDRQESKQLKLEESYSFSKLEDFLSEKKGKKAPTLQKKEVAKQETEKTEPLETPKKPKKQPPRRPKLIRQNAIALFDTAQGQEL